ncbi:MAG: hypothetical protein HYV02_07270 [Deltaproteobacteria bacterium]|nr:hypothetical protein [Deltaproteobacteria bacterium]
MTVQGIANALQDLYCLERTEIRDFLISPAAYAAHCPRGGDGAPHRRETLLIARQDNVTYLGLYIAPAILERLIAQPPITQLDRTNLDATCVAIEGVSHLLCATWKLAHDMPFTQLELELQAEIDKYLLCARWLHRQGRTTEILADLFHHYTLCGGMDAEAAERYDRAAFLAWHYCRTINARFFRRHRLSAIPPVVRDFYRLTHWQKLRRLGARYSS